MQTAKLLNVVLFVLSGVLAMVGWDLHSQLHVTKMENARHEGILDAPKVCTPVQVTCVCPEYEEGWDDAEFSQGQIPENPKFELEDLDVEELERLCSEFEEYGYVPRC